MDVVTLLIVVFVIAGAGALVTKAGVLRACWEAYAYLWRASRRKE